MTLKEKYTQFDKTAPLRTARLTHGSFTYRYYKNNQSPSGNITLVFLAGGTGLGDSLFYLYDSLLPKYSLITFNYPMDFPTNVSLCDAMAELFEQKLTLDNDTFENTGKSRFFERRTSRVLY